MSEADDLMAVATMYQQRVEELKDELIYPMSDARVQYMKRVFNVKLIAYQEGIRPPAGPEDVAIVEGEPGTYPAFVSQ